jgi:hypothetical protein
MGPWGVWPVSGNPGYPEAQFDVWKSMTERAVRVYAGTKCGSIRKGQSLVAGSASTPDATATSHAFALALGELESTAAVTAGEVPALIKALLSEGLIEAVGRDAWKITQAGHTLSSATAGRADYTRNGRKSAAAIP